MCVSYPPAQIQVFIGLHAFLLCVCVCLFILCLCVLGIHELCLEKI